MQLRDRQIEHVGIKEEREELGHAEIASVLEHEVAADADDAQETELGDQSGGGAIERPAEHSFERLELELFCALLKAGGLAFLQAECLDQAVALDIFDQEAVELA